MQLQLTILLALVAGACAGDAPAMRIEWPTATGVLQRDRPTPVHGRAPAHAEILVTYAQTQIKTQADASGRWIAVLPAMASRPDPVDLTARSGDLTNTVPGVRVGDVWFVSGQSNCSPKFAEAFRTGLEAQAGIPIGIFYAAIGGSSIEMWLDPQPDFINDLVALGVETRKAPKWGDLHRQHVLPKMPIAGKGILWYQGESNAIKTVGYTRKVLQIRNQYMTLSGADALTMIVVQLPGYRVDHDEEVKVDGKKTNPKRQSGPYAPAPFFSDEYPRTPATEPGETGWQWVREQQWLVQRTPGCHTVVQIDLGGGGIHPDGVNKKELVRRICLLTAARCYGKAGVVSGPVYKDMKVERGSIRVTFTDVGGGLVDRRGGPVRGFAVAGADKLFVWADARIDGNAVLVTSAAVPNPVAVRYAFSQDPDATLHNREGFPTAPFRSDDWPPPERNDIK